MKWYVLSLMLLCLTTSLLADSPRIVESVQFTELGIHGEMQKGQIVTLSVQIQAMTAIEGDLVVRFPKRIFKPLIAYGDTVTAVHMTLTPGESVKRSYQLRVDEYGEDMFEVYFIATKAPQGFAQIVYSDKSVHPFRLISSTCSGIIRPLVSMKASGMSFCSDEGVGNVSWWTD